MQILRRGVGVSLVVGASLASVAACSASSRQPTGGAGGVGGSLVTPGDSGAPDGFAECAQFDDVAKQAPAAMLIVLDRTASMSQQGKWSTAQLAIVKAIDAPVFDTMSLGMLTFPAPNSVPGPACILGFPIYCDVSALPQVAMNAAGTAKSSDPSGVRHDIYQYLVNNGPEGQDSSDSSPIYAALNGAYQFIRGVSGVDKRLVLLITDGGGSCTSISNPPRPAYQDGNGCNDWEQPPVMAKLIEDARNDVAKPVNTFVVGVPGSDSTGQKVGAWDTPPYSMILALSSYAVAGSPDTVDPTCDKAAAFSQSAPAPAKPCHIDLSGGSAFNEDALAKAISDVRGKALGCVYDLPAPPPGQTIDPALVNVVLTIDGKETTVPKRKDATDTCAAEPCWDYDAQGRVELVGAACQAAAGAASAKVQIFVGCATVIK